MINAIESNSIRPYLIRALYEWCTDNGFTPYVVVQVDNTVQVPREYVKNDEIVLNIGFDATSSLKLGNDFIEFKARFAGTAREILVPIGRVTAIYARESGEGVAFLPFDVEPAVAGSLRPSSSAEEADRVVHLVADDVPKGGAADMPEPGDPPRPPHQPKGGGARPALKRIK